MRGDSSTKTNTSTWWASAEIWHTRMMPTHPRTVDVRAVDDFYELRDKGGILGKINVRVYFVIRPDIRGIFILAAVKKEAEGQIPRMIKTRVAKRMNILFGRSC